MAGAPGRAHQGAQGKALAQQLLAQGAADEACGPGEGYGVACRRAAALAGVDPGGFGLRDQADATLMRNSSVTAFRFSGSWELMKSIRALARDSLPEDVLGSE